MRTLLRLVASITTAASPLVHAQLAPRTVRFASIETNTVVNEVVADDRFFFEKCDFYHVDGVNVFEELAAQKFVNCNALGLSQPLAARERVLQQLDEDLLTRRRELADPDVFAWGLTGALQGGLIGGAGAVLLNRISPRMFRRGSLRDPVRVFATFGGFSAVVVGWSSARKAIKRQGQNHPTLEVFDERMPTSLYLLDQRTNDRRAQLRAMDNVTDVITRTMTDFVP